MFDPISKISEHVGRFRGQLAADDFLSLRAGLGEEMGGRLWGQLFALTEIRERLYDELELRLYYQLNTKVSLTITAMMKEATIATITGKAMLAR